MTAELAVALPALVLVTVLAVWAVGVAAMQVRCVDAARMAARALARGEAEPAARTLAVESAPPGASVQVAAEPGGLVVVEVRARVDLPGPWPGQGVAVGSRAVASVEGWSADPGSTGQANP